MLTNSLPVVEHGKFLFGEDLWTACTIIQKLKNNNYKIKFVHGRSNLSIERTKSRDEIWIDTKNEYKYGEAFLNNSWFPCRFQTLEPFQGQYAVGIIWSSLAMEQNLVGMNLILPREKIQIGSELHYNFECALQKNNLDCSLNLIQQNPLPTIRNSKNNQDETFLMILLKYSPTYFYSSVKEYQKFRDITLELIHTQNCDINVGIKSNGIYPFAITPLILAICHKRNDLVSELLQIPSCDVNLQVNGTSALRLTIDHFNTHPQMFFALLSRKDLDINQTNCFGHDGETALFYLSKNQSINPLCIETLIDFDCDVNVYINNMTPLMYAIQHRWKKIALQLIKMKSNIKINLTNDEGQNILMQSLLCGHYELALYILKFFPECEIHDSAFAFCCDLSHPNLIEACLNHPKFDYEFISEHLLSALMENDVETLQLFFKYGINIQNFASLKSLTEFKDFCQRHSIHLGKNALLNFTIDQKRDPEISKQFILANCDLDGVAEKNQYALKSCLEKIQAEILQFHKQILDLDIYSGFSEELEPFIYRQDIGMWLYTLRGNEYKSGEFDINLPKEYSRRNSIFDKLDLYSMESETEEASKKFKKFAKLQKSYGRRNSMFSEYSLNTIDDVTENASTKFENNVGSDISFPKGEDATILGIFDESDLLDESDDFECMDTESGSTNKFVGSPIKSITKFLDIYNEENLETIESISEPDGTPKKVKPKSDINLASDDSQAIHELFDECGFLADDESEDEPKKLKKKSVSFSTVDFLTIYDLLDECRSLAADETIVSETEDEPKKLEISHKCFPTGDAEILDIFAFDDLEVETAKALKNDVQNNLLERHSRRNSKTLEILEPLTEDAPKQFETSDVKFQRGYSQILEMFGDNDSESVTLTQDALNTFQKPTESHTNFQRGYSTVLEMFDEYSVERIDSLSSSTDSPKKDLKIYRKRRCSKTLEIFDDLQSMNIVEGSSITTCNKNSPRGLGDEYGLEIIDSVMNYASQRLKRDINFNAEYATILDVLDKNNLQTLETENDHVQNKVVKIYRKRRCSKTTLEMFDDLGTMNIVEEWPKLYEKLTKSRVNFSRGYSQILEIFDEYGWETVTKGTPEQIQESTKKDINFGKGDTQTLEILDNPDYISIIDLETDDASMNFEKLTTSDMNFPKEACSVLEILSDLESLDSEPKDTLTEFEKLTASDIHFPKRDGKLLEIMCSVESIDSETEDDESASTEQFLESILF